MMKKSGFLVFLRKKKRKNHQPCSIASFTCTQKFNPIRHSEVAKLSVTDAPTDTKLCQIFILKDYSAC